MTELHEWDGVFLYMWAQPMPFHAHGYFETHKFKNPVLCVSQPIRDESDNITSG